MDTLQHLAEGFGVALMPMNLLVAAIGALIGTIVGMLPGLGPINGVALLMPLAGRLPFEWIYPTGEKQEIRIPRWHEHYQWATVIAGDCHYVRRHIPDGLNGQIIATNTTTQADVEIFKQVGIKYLVTSTPIIEGRSFGTNMMEAALIAVSGKGRVLSKAELSSLLDQLHFEPQLQELN